MVDILLTNDDGYKCRGFLALYQELSKHYSVVAIAPAEEKSWIGKSISKFGALELKKTIIDGLEVHYVNGTPADCVQIGIYDLLKEKPKLVVSGINVGANVGHGRILSSGTVGAAMEASIDGVKSIASSMYIQDLANKDEFFHVKDNSPFEQAAQVTTRMITILFDQDLGTDVDLISINIPQDATENTDFETTVPFREPYGRLFHKKDGKFIHVVPPFELEKLEVGTDLKTLVDGKISITPISLELASKKSMKSVDGIIRSQW